MLKRGAIQIWKEEKYADYWQYHKCFRGIPLVHLPSILEDELFSFRFQFFLNVRLNNNIKNIFDIQNALKEFGISKSVYNDWRSEAYCEKDFGKKMFVNMAFILGLNYENAEKLLNLNGYTFESVGRQFDEICRKAFKIGFSRDMTIALIEKRNRELAKSNIKFALIPNLTSNKQ